MVRLREIVMIHDLRRQGLGVSAIARQTGLDRKTVRKYLEQGMEAARYGPRRPRPRLLDPYADYLGQRVASFPGLSGRRLWREISELGYAGGYSAVTDFLREVRPPARALETLRDIVQRLERSEIGALEAIDALLAEELDVRENRRIGVARKTARLTPPKTLESFDFSFQPSLDRDRILALAQLDFVDRAEVVHLLGPPGPGP